MGHSEVCSGLTVGGGSTGMGLEGESRISVMKTVASIGDLVTATEMVMEMRNSIQWFIEES